MFFVHPIFFLDVLPSVSVLVRLFAFLGCWFRVLYVLLFVYSYFQLFFQNLIRMNVKNWQKSNKTVRITDVNSVVLSIELISCRFRNFKNKYLDNYKWKIGGVECVRTRKVTRIRFRCRIIKGTWRLCAFFAETPSIMIIINKIIEKHISINLWQI